MGTRAAACRITIGLVILVLAGCVPPPPPPPPPAPAAPVQTPSPAVAPPAAPAPTTTPPTTTIPDTSTSLTIASEYGDEIGRGISRTYLPSDGLLDAVVDRQGNRIFGGFSDGSLSGWRFEFEAPQGEAIAVGPYEAAESSVFTGSPTKPGQSIQKGSRCDTSKGRFDVRQLDQDASGNITRLAVEFVQYCNGNFAALRGTIRINATDPYPAVPDRDGDGRPDTVDNCPLAYNAGQADRDRDRVGDACDAGTSQTWLEVRSSTGDPVGGGARTNLYPMDGNFFADTHWDGGLVELSFYGGTESWRLEFSVPSGVLAPGTYTGAVPSPTTERNLPGLSVSRDGSRSCGVSTGTFTVREVAFDAAGEVSRFSADFEQRCDVSSPALRGSLRFQVASNPPAPPAVTNRPPVVTSLMPSVRSGSSPVTSTITMAVSDPDGDPLTCVLGTGRDEFTIPSCTSDSVRVATFVGEGTDGVDLWVSDGKAPAVHATTWVTVAREEADTYGIQVRFVGSMTQPQRSAFSSASTKWGDVIAGGLSDVALTMAAGECIGGAPAFSGTVDDIMIDAMITPIDGPGGILGSAGPCIVRSAGGLTVYGVMMFDSADVAGLEATDQFKAVVLHEMGHVLGFGTLWDGSVLAGAGGSDPRFVGPTALAAWQELGGTGSIPVENSGGAGTADSHWRESILGPELMTGYLDAGVTPLSILTAASLADLGYQVDLRWSDPFFPTIAAASPLTALRQAADPVAPPTELEVLPVRPHRSV